jgi:hypothetical protein
MAAGSRPLPEDDDYPKKGKSKKRLKKKIKKLQLEREREKRYYSLLKKDLYQIIDNPDTDKTKMLIEVLKAVREMRRNSARVMMFGDSSKKLKGFQGIAGITIEKDK